MKENLFSVDLGDLKLTDTERQRINGAIHKAVAGELATISAAAKSRVVLVPVSKWPKWPILWGIILRPIDDIFLDSIKKTIELTR